ncbi:MAG: bifunctional riboflavin kinase/FAD synthetase [Sandaracinaceae bacterium]
MVVPGNHDGVHLGHVALLARARAVAARLEARVVALTFDPHPLVLLSPTRAPEALTSIERRTELLRQAGADEVVVARFDERFAKLGPAAFVEHELVERLGACAVVIGADFRFGQGRAGDPEMLRQYGARLGFEVEVVDAVAASSLERVSSSAIREALKAGAVDEAARLLGRPYELDGQVVAGHRRGRTLGFPTANLDGIRVLVPRDGVYAVVARVLRDGRPRADEPPMCGMLNVGTRPTFDAGRSVEVHLLDVERDLYGATLRLGFVARLRDEQRFPGLDALVAQLRSDALAARSLASPVAARADVLG